MIEVAEAALSRERPWPGMRPYREGDADYFFGRDAEIAELLARTERSLLTLLYARGGLGKTSLVRAGLAPRLIERGYLPVYLRPRALLQHGRDPVAEVIRAIETAARDGDIEATAPFAAPSLWELFHRESFDLWDAANRFVTPVLAFDQFEEIFQLIDDDAAAVPRVKLLLDNIAELVENRLPARLAAIELPADDAHRFDIAAKDYRVLLSFREDYLPQVRKLRTIVPSVVENHVRLEALSGNQALEVVEKAGGNLIDHEAATALVRGVGHRAGLMQLLVDRATSSEAEPEGAVSGLEVDPAILSVVCFYLNAERQRRRRRSIDVGLVRFKKPEDIFDDYYRAAVAKVGPEVRSFIETRLVTSDGERVLYPLKAIEANEPRLTGPLGSLVDQGILRKEWLAGEQRLEISHDLLLRPIRHAVEEARAAAARAKRLRRWGLAAATFVVVLTFLWDRQRRDLIAQLEKREEVSEALLVAYVPLTNDPADPEQLKNRMAEFIYAADQAAGSAAGAGALEQLFDWSGEIGSSVHPITARRLRDVVVGYVQLKIDRGDFAAGALEPLLLKLRSSVGQSCAKGFTQSGDSVVTWFADKGGVPAECR
jgi:hypothetical protein